MITIKGNGVPNAKGYELRMKYTDQGTPEYPLIDFKMVGKVKYDIQDYVDSNGGFVANLSYWRRTDFVDVNELANDELGFCVTVNGEQYDTLNYAFYSEKNVASFIKGSMVTEGENSPTMLEAYDLQDKARECGAKYIVFCSDTQYEDCPELVVNLKNHINFNLDDYEDFFNSWDVQEFELIVKAIGEGDIDTDGDGIIYADSDYSNVVVHSLIIDDVEDELQGTWVLEDFPDIYETLIVSVNFNSNNEQYTEFNIDYRGAGLYSLEYNEQVAYVDNQGEQYWTNNTYKTINITSKLAEVTNGADLLAWLKANATKQGTSTPTLISFTLDGKEYQAEEGMTWADWVASEYNTGRYRADGYHVSDEYSNPIENSADVWQYPTDYIIVNESYNATSGTHSGGMN